VIAIEPVDPRLFYDTLAADYHLLFDDWWESARRQGHVLAGLLRRHGVHPPARVLDCTCGIGTQALPLAQLGYRVVGSDISPDAVERARSEARTRDIDVQLVTADVRSVADAVGQVFDAVITADNSLPHLLTDEDLAAALASLRRCLQPGGLLLASSRDYDALVRDRVTGVVPTEHDIDGQRWIVGQAWTWAADHKTVQITLFLLVQRDRGWTPRVRTTTYRALLRDELTTALIASGFEDVNWIHPDESGYYQQIVTARAGDGS
jgi:glycine/sarcosine N-methyltransferase